jgi:hypothetical protein
MCTPSASKTSPTSAGPILAESGSGPARTIVRFSTRYMLLATGRHGDVDRAKSVDTGEPYMYV